LSESEKVLPSSLTPFAFEIRADGKNRVLAEEARHKMLSAANRRSAQRSAELDLASLRALT
jgi:hypothetical protein